MATAKIALAVTSVTLEMNEEEAAMLGVLLASKEVTDYCGRVGNTAQARTQRDVFTSISNTLKEILEDARLAKTGQPKTVTAYAENADG